MMQVYEVKGVVVGTSLLWIPETWHPHYEMPQDWHPRLDVFGTGMFDKSCACRVYVEAKSHAGAVLLAKKLFESGSSQV